MKENKVYWRGIEELRNDTDFVKNAEKEFPDFIPLNEKNPSVDSFDGKGNNRRDFLKLLGFSVAAASLAACETPVKKAIPYLNKPEDIDPSIPNYYASTYINGSDYASVLVKTREGRPIKIEGNPLSPVSLGGTSSRVQASVLDLYDETRYMYFVDNGKTALDIFDENKDLEKIEDANDLIDQKIISVLGQSSKIRIVTPTVVSPSTEKAIADFQTKFAGTQHVTYDILSADGILTANQETFGSRMVPAYAFDKAEVIVGIEADFLGTWINPVQFARQYANTRKVSTDNKKMSRHYQFETGLSLTGANADYRGRMTPSQLGLVVKALHSQVTGGSEKTGVAELDALVSKAAKELTSKKGKSLVVCGSNDPSVQIVINAINNALNSYGATIDAARPLMLKKGNDASVQKLIADINSNAVDAVIFWGVNPVYDYGDTKLADAIKKLSVSISFAEKPDETSVLCKYIIPDFNYLESWNDAQPQAGSYSLTQPTISPLFRTRQAQSSLLKWAGLDEDYYTYIKKYWEENLFPQQSEKNTFEDFWTYSLYNGIVSLSGDVTPSPTVVPTPTPEQTVPTDSTTAQAPTPEQAEPAKAGDFNNAPVAAAVSDLSANYKAKAEGMELILYPKVSIATGDMANNPWLQEMADPISRASWGNYVAISQKTAKELEIEQDDVLEVSADGKTTVKLPALIQPGQTEGTIAIALGYGRTECGKVGKGVGANLNAWIDRKGDTNQYNVKKVNLSKTGDSDQIAQIQTHSTIMGRGIVQEASLGEYQDEKKFTEIKKSYGFEIHTTDGVKKPTNITLWKGHKYPNHSWGLVVDLNSCIGCGACTIACQAENNVPVVGKQEVINRREMHWIRIDRYYSSPEGTGANDYAGLEKAAENPEVTFQPMMCQHCNNAPCETVCPVLATTHSTEGLNQMTYNRCIGTRYCANNCPYKVRRFNWFHYAADDRFTEVNYQQTTELGKMVLNPDVTVRSRGIMEKCSMCVQRIQAGKLEAKKQKRKVRDGEINVACAQSCPTEGLVFGDMNDPESQISKLLAIKEGVNEQFGHSKQGEKVYEITEPRAFHVLEEINVRPQVSYLMKIRNKDTKESKA